MRPHRLLFLALCLSPGAARGQAADQVIIEVAGSTRALSATQLLSLPQDTARARAHGGPEQVFVGPRLSAVLTLAGARLDSLRGRALAQYVLVEARDNYRVVFGIAELASDFSTHRVILAHTADGQSLSAEQGPWRVIVEGELRQPAGYARSVRCGSGPCRNDSGDAGAA